jgi:hypothetical protein
MGYDVDEFDGGFSDNQNACEDFAASGFHQIVDVNDDNADYSLRSGTG